MNVTRKAKHRGLATLTLLIVGLSCPAISASAAGSATPGGSVSFRLVDAPPGNGGVSLANLAGERTYLSVGPGGEPPWSFVIQSLVARRDQQGQPVVTAQVRNTGGRALDLDGQASLSGGPGRLSAGPFNAKNETLPIGQSADVLIPLGPAIPPGSWEVQVTLHSGLIQNTAEAVIDVPSAPAQAPVRARPVTSGPGHLIPIAGVVLVGTASVELARRLRRRRLKRLPPRGSRPLPRQRARTGVR